MSALTPEQITRIKERVADRAEAIMPEAGRERIDTMVDTFVRYLDEATTEILNEDADEEHRVMTLQEMIDHDAAVGLPGFRRTLPKRVKTTTLTDGITGLTDTKNYLCSVGPDHDPHKEIVTFRVTYHPPRRFA